MHLNEHKVCHYIETNWYHDYASPSFYFPPLSTCIITYAQGSLSLPLLSLSLSLSRSVPLSLSSLSLAPLISFVLQSELLLVSTLAQFSQSTWKPRKPPAKLLIGLSNVNVLPVHPASAYAHNLPYFHTRTHCHSFPREICAGAELRLCSLLLAMAIRGKRGENNHTLTCEGGKAPKTICQDPPVRARIPTPPPTAR